MKNSEENFFFVVVVVKNSLAFFCCVVFKTKVFLHSRFFFLSFSQPF
jgi:hypothetical protein